MRPNMIKYLEALTLPFGAIDGGSHVLLTANIVCSAPQTTTALGAGANVRACELKTPCSNLVEVALADLFHFEA